MRKFMEIPIPESLAASSDNPQLQDSLLDDPWHRFLQILSLALYSTVHRDDRDMLSLMSSSVRFPIKIGGSEIFKAERSLLMSLSPPGHGYNLLCLGDNRMKNKVQWIHTALWLDSGHGFICGWIRVLWPSETWWLLPSGWKGSLCWH